MEHNQNHFAPEAATDEPASPCRSITDFEPVPLRYRTDGLTPAKQREFVEALADTGVAREAAARIGMSEQAVNRVRRRADARAFDLACEAAQRIGARCLRSVAWQRAIKGTVKGIYYHGELKSEEVVYDNRLLIYLLGKAEKMLEPPPEAEAVVANWEGWMDAIERGLPGPEPEPEAKPRRAPVPARCDDELDASTWEEEDGIWWTIFPPPDGFNGAEHGRPGDGDYRRTLSEAEQACVNRAVAAAEAEELAGAAAERDAVFGFAGGLREAPLFCPREAEPYETSEPPDPPPDGGA
jgi:hypothetical protein